MKTYSLLVALALLCCGVAQNAFAQSAVYVYKNVRTGEGDYMVVYSMPSEADAEFLAQEKLVEMGYSDELIRKQASSASKGFGLIISSTYQDRFGKVTKLYGAAIGCKSVEQARADALTNLKRYNPEWVDGTAVEEVQKFIDR